MNQIGEGGGRWGQKKAIIIATSQLKQARLVIRQKEQAKKKKKKKLKRLRSKFELLEPRNDAYYIKKIILVYVGIEPN